MALGDALGEHSLLTLDEGRHMSQRKLLLPAFHGESVRRYAEVMAEETAREVDRWPVGREFPLRPRMQAITLEVILRAVFGVRDGERMNLLRTRIPRLAETTSVLNWLPVMERDLGGLSPAAKFRKALAAVDELIYAEIADRRESEPGEDVLSLLLAARHEDGSPMSDVELRDELMTLLTAGHETTATGLSWAFERLMRTPRVMERLLDSLDDDEYLDAVVKETLRIRPVIVDVARKLTRPDGDRRLHPPRGHARAAGDRGGARTRRPLSGAGGVPARALHRRAARVVRVDPVRRRRAALHRRLVRPGGDARGAARGAAARAPAGSLGTCRAPAHPARDRGARPRRARRGDRAAERAGRARSWPRRPPRHYAPGTSGRVSGAGTGWSCGRRNARRLAGAALLCRARPCSARSACTRGPPARSGTAG